VNYVPTNGNNFWRRTRKKSRENLRVVSSMDGGNSLNALCCFRVSLLFCASSSKLIFFIYILTVASIIIHRILENETSEKVAQSRTEYKPCHFTESDEEFRMLQMQFICLIVGLFSVRNVRRYKTSSASLFDQRRMRGNTNQGGGGGGAVNGSGGNSSASPSKHAKYSGYSKKDSLESVELGPLIKKTTGAGKVPKSPAPSNMNAV
jgi:hypothetical protein